MKQFILAIDQGTTGTRAAIVDHDIRVVANEILEFPQHFPKPSWVEHDLNEIWQSVEKAVERVLAKSGISEADIATIGITNQRETTCVWDSDGNPVCNAIVWQDRRTAPQCESLKKKGVEPWIRRRTGLCLDPYFSATKMSWLLKNNDAVKRLAKSGQARFGTIDSFLLFRITGQHATDVSNASRTLLMNLNTLEWDDDLLKLFGIPKSVLPSILPSMVEYGTTRNFLNIPNGTPVTGLAGDQQAALFGQACFEKGSTKCTYGTGAFALVNIGPKPIFSKHKLLTTVCWKDKSGTTYGIEGSSFVAGAAVQWARDGLKLVEKSSDIEALAAEAQDADGVVFVPALSGLGAPHWTPTATGLLTGITRRTNRSHIARAILEGVAFEVGELLNSMKHDLGRKITSIKVDGGASSNDILMQFQADILGIKVVRSKILETTALGAALQAGLAIGFWQDKAQIQQKWQADKEFLPHMTTSLRAAKMRKWEATVAAVKKLSIA